VKRREYFSQFGEDKVIRLLTRVFWFTPKVIIDIGANDGWSWSNSRKLILNGWSAHLIEPIPKFYGIAKGHYLDFPKVQVYQLAISNVDGEFDFFIHENESTDLLQMGSSLIQNSLPSHSFSQIKVQVREINNFIASCKIESQIGIMSLDTEGNDELILKSLDFFTYQPFIFVIEVAEGNYEIAKFMKLQNYHFLTRSVANEIYISKSSIHLDSFVRNLIFKMVKILFKFKLIRRLFGLKE
jgi:FkbM family methyltransferase